MHLIRVEDPAFFDSIVQKQLLLNSSVFILFYGRDIPETGESYCPDCVRALPNIYKALSTLPNSTLITTIVDKRTETDSPTWVYRTREDIKLTGVPTLCVWDKSGIVAQLVEEECFDYQSVLKFVSSS
ncbi:hypothetical protein BB561_006471 [Smittium simulii]|uniref:Thioredoxin domain-containing protein n=1 Tax=Smittium simulii TaxID=133385 RepID=A0A2T9Y403_9FUNG|nr:hypothetical protein BB561_006471 [Smittium simulii]